MFSDQLGFDIIKYYKPEQSIVSNPILYCYVLKRKEYFTYVDLLIVNKQQIYSFINHAEYLFLSYLFTNHNPSYHFFHIKPPKKK